jgi:selenocysteine lyase/cysteine desulfurase
VLSPAEIARNLSPATRVVCLSWVHSFSGWTLDIEAIGKLCRDNGTWLIVNATQGLGPRSLDVSRTPVDAVVASGWKWLCGPYSTGLGWLRRELRETLTTNQRYWLTMGTAEDLGSEHDDTEGSPPDEARRYDIFGTANFFNFHAWGATLDYLLECGVDAIGRHDEKLVDRLIAGLDPERYELISPAQGESRSTLVFLAHKAGRNREVYDRCVAKRVHVAFRRGMLRVAPHLYNTDRDIDRMLAILHAD